MQEIMTSAELIQELNTAVEWEILTKAEALEFHNWLNSLAETECKPIPDYLQPLMDRLELWLMDESEMTAH